jgi:ubiquinol-cytochrome c reductase iron-sulfur subunit
LSDTTHPTTAPSGAKRIDPHEVGTGVTRRDFLVIATGAFAAVGVAGTLWPFIDQMNPDAAALALASTEVDVSSIEPGQSIIAVWQGKPVAVRYRTEEEMKAAQQVPLDELKDPNARNANLDSNATATDENRTRPGKEEWLVMVQVCTHLGCVPLGQQGDFGRLVLSLPWLAIRYRGPHPPRSGA